MKLQQHHKKYLLFVFIALLFTFAFTTYKYVEAKNEAVEKLQKQGFICTKNILGVYSSCREPMDLNLNLTIYQEEKQ